LPRGDASLADGDASSDAGDTTLRGDADLPDATTNTCPLSAPTQQQQCTLEMVDETCMYPTLRCRCEVGSGARWNCESNSCPENPQANTPCTPGLRCGAGFEDPGYTCVLPENVWARCPNNHFRDLSFTTRTPLACPDPRPEEGTPCCQATYPV